MPAVEARDVAGAGAETKAEVVNKTRSVSNLAENADRAGEPVRADAAPTDKVAGEEAAMPMVMPAVAHEAKAETAVSADDSRISRMIGAKLGVQDEAAARAAGRPPSSLAEHVTKPSLWDVALADKSVPAGAEPADKVAAEKVVIQIVMSVAADAVRGEAAVSADDSRIE